MVNQIKSIFRFVGFDIHKRYSQLQLDPHYADFERSFIPFHDKVSPFTMTTRERLYALHQAVKYIVRNGIGGDFVECGVWKGGSAMMIALTLLDEGINDRKIYLFDTYEGMTQPSEKDRDPHGKKAFDRWSKSMKNRKHSDWCYASLGEVQSNMARTRYPEQHLHYIQGKVEETIPATLPAGIALLRLDTDWYESTYHEMKHLFPLLSPQGVLIVDDYGFWKGSREAVDQYFKETNKSLLFNRIDASSRLIINNIT